MANEIGDLVIKIQADVSNMQASLSKIGAQTKETGTGFTALGVGIGMMAVQAGMAIIQNIGSALQAVTIDASNMAKEILDVAEATGLNTDEVQKFQLAADMEGKSFDTVTSMVKFYSKAMEQALLAADSGKVNEASKSFEALGINLPAFKLMSTGQQLDVLIPKLMGMTNANDRMVAGQALLGRGFINNIDIMNAYVNEGPKIEAMAKKFGIPKEALQSTAQLKQGMGELKFITDNLALKIGSELVPILMKMEPLIMKIATAISDWLNNPKNIEGLTKLADGVGKFIDLLLKAQALYEGLSKWTSEHQLPVMLGLEKPKYAYASGGIASSPQIASIGESGPEAVIPLSKMGGMGGGVNVTIQAGAFMGSREDARSFARMLQELMRNENNTRTYGRLV